MSRLDYYKILGVKRDESQLDVRKTYRRLARKCHPDLNPGDKSSEERFKAIQEAYRILGNPKKRKIYDQQGYSRDMPGNNGKAGFPESEGFSGFNFYGDRKGHHQNSFRNIFSDLFGTRQSSSGSKGFLAGRNLEFKVLIPFLEAVCGTQTRINLKRQVHCSECKNTGATSQLAKKACPVCQGHGKVSQNRGIMCFSTPCSHCRGKGQIEVSDCKECKGSNLVQRIETLRVRIPPGVDSGSRIRVARKGYAGKGGLPPGDLFLIVKIKPHFFFRRKRNNIFCSVPVTVKEAALGSEINVPTVNGKARLRIPAGTQSGQKFRLRGRGIFSTRSGSRGDQLVEVKIVLPNIQDKRSKEILCEFADLNPQNPRKHLDFKK